METKVNVRGEINALEVNQPLILPKDTYKLSVVRSTAASIKGDTGKVFTVSTDSEAIIVIRVS